MCSPGFYGIAHHLALPLNAGEFTEAQGDAISSGSSGKLDLPRGGAICCRLKSPRCTDWRLNRMDILAPYHQVIRMT